MSDLTRLTGDTALFTRRGACPALSAPMQTGDGFLVRLNPVSGGVSPMGLIALCDAARRHGNGIVEITARGSFQVRGLTTASAAALACDVDAIGIAVRTGVPVQTSVLAGLDPNEIADPSGLAETLRKNLRISGLEARLGPKVSVVVDGGGRSELDDVSGDVRLTAMENERWRVAVAGDARTAAEVGVFAEEVTAEVALALLGAVAEKGIAARGRDLSEDDIAHLIPPPLPPPHKGEREPATPLPTAEHEGVPPRCGEGSGVGVTSPITTLILTLPLTDSRHALGIAIPFGSTNAETLATFAAKAQSLEIKDLRFAPRRILLALCPSPAAATALQNTAKTLGFVTSPADPRLHISACPGAPACASGLLPTRDLAASLAASSLLDGSLSLHISGCAKGCAHPSIADLTLVGTANGAGIVVGGTARQVPLAYTSPDRAEHALERIAKLVATERRGNERSASVLARWGREMIAEAFGKR